MNTGKPLFTLSIEEFIALTRSVVADILAEQKPNNGEIKEISECFDISELANFLHCSKVSIHNYKKAGLPYYKVGRKLLFNKSEVLSFMKGLKRKRYLG